MIRSLGPATSLSSQPVSSVTTPLLVTRFQLPRMPDMWSSLGGLLIAAWYYRYFFNLFTFLSKVYLKFWTHAGAVSTVSYQDKDDTNKRFKNSFLSRSLIWPIPIICHFFHHINLHPAARLTADCEEYSNIKHRAHLAGDNGDNATLSNHWLVWNSMFVKHKLCQLMTVSMWSVLDRGTTTVYLQRWHLATNKVWHLSGAEKLEQEIWNRDSF